MSKFNFQVKCTLNVDATTFNKNYLNFLNTVVNAVKTSLSSLTMLSL